MTKDNLQTLYNAQDKFSSILFGAEKKIGIEGVILASGTALARCYLKHRASFDLDFFVPFQFSAEKLLAGLSRSGISLQDISVGDEDMFVAQVHAYTVVGGVRLKVSFVEDAFAGMFDPASLVMRSIDQEGSTVRTETLDGLYHRKLRTIAGSAYGGDPRVIEGRQAARDLFDLYHLNKREPIHQFVHRINQGGANFPEAAFISGITGIRWVDLMDDFPEIIQFDGAPSEIEMPDIRRILESQAVKLREANTNNGAPRKKHGH